MFLIYLPVLIWYILALHNDWYHKDIVFQVCHICTLTVLMTHILYFLSCLLLCQNSITSMFMSYTYIWTLKYTCVYIKYMYITIDMFIKIFDSTSVSEGMQYMLVWVILFNMMIVSCIHFPTNVIILFFFINEENYIVYTYYLFYTQTPVHRYLGSLHVSCMSSDILNMDVKVFLWYVDLESLMYTTKCSLAGSYGRTFSSSWENSLIIWSLQSCCFFSG